MTRCRLPSPNTAAQACTQRRSLRAARLRAWSPTSGTRLALPPASQTVSAPSRARQILCLRVRKSPRSYVHYAKQRRALTHAPSRPAGRVSTPVGHGQEGPSDMQPPPDIAGLGASLGTAMRREGSGERAPGDAGSRLGAPARRSDPRRPSPSPANSASSQLRQARLNLNLALPDRDSAGAGADEDDASADGQLRQALAGYADPSPPPPYAQGQFECVCVCRQRD